MSKKNTKLKAFQETLKENIVTLANIEKNDGLIRIIKRNADAVRDYRHPFYVRHLLGDIIMLTFFAVLANANEWDGIHGQDILAVDGKESRGFKRKTAEGETEALRTLNVYSTDYGICLGQKFIKEKTNEIPAAQELLPLIDMKGSIVTADAMNCQKGTAAAIIAGGGDYVLAFKENHPLFMKKWKNTSMRIQGNG